MDSADSFYTGAWSLLDIVTYGISDHWKAHDEWNHQKTQYSFFLFADAPELEARMETAAEGIDHPHLTPVKKWEQHLTLLSIASSQNVSSDELAALTTEAKAICAATPAFTLRVGGFNRMNGNVIAEVRPWEALLALREELYGMSGRVMGAARVMARPEFTPHFTLAYADDRIASDEVRALLETKRHEFLGDLNVTSVALVELRREDKSYRFRTVAQLELAHEQQKVPK